MEKQLVNKIRGTNPLATRGMQMIRACLDSFACLLSPRHLGASNVLRAALIGMMALVLGVGGLVASAEAATYHARGVAAQSVGADGSTNIVAEGGVSYSPIVGTQWRAITTTAAVTATVRNRIRQSANWTGTEQCLRIYTPTYAVAKTIAANATSQFSAYNDAGSVYAVLYEYNDTTGVVGAAKGTSNTAAFDATTVVQMVNLTFNNASFTVASGNRLVVWFYLISNAADPRPVYGSVLNTTNDSGDINLTVTETVPTCTPANPTVTISTAPATITTNGGSAVYNFTVTNNDSASCANRTFALANVDTAVTNFNASNLSTASTSSLAPGATSPTYTLTTNATSGQYTGSVTSTITASQGANSGNDAVTTTLNVPCTPGAAPTMNGGSFSGNPIDICSAVTAGGNTVTNYLVTSGTSPDDNFDDNSLAAKWTKTDFGPDVGTVSETGGQLSLAGGGADIWNAADQFTFLSQSGISGDFSIQVKVLSQQNTNAWAKAGLMVREQLTAGSKDAYMVTTPANGARWQYRDTTDALAINPSSNQGGSSTAPVWLRITRTGNSFTGEFSTDGTNWIVSGTNTIVMADPVYIGLANTSHVAGTLSTTVFDDFVTTGLSTTLYNGATCNSVPTTGWTNGTYGLTATYTDTCGTTGQTLAGTFTWSASTPGTIALSAATYSVSEAGPTVTVTATRTGGSSGTVGISYGTSNGTATGGSDYTATSGTLSWAAGDTANKTFTVTISNDTLDELNETFNVALTTPTGGATLGTPNTAVVTITDNDAAPTVAWTAATQASTNETGTMTVTAQLSAASGQTVTVPFTVSGTATSGTDYTAIAASPITIAAGNPSGTRTITITSDVLVEGNETVILTMGTPTNAALGATTVHTATITDDDVAPGTIALSAATYSVGEAGTTVTITAKRTLGTSGVVGITYATSNGTATAGSDYTTKTGTLSWANGDAADKTFTVTILNDTTTESNETFNVTLSAPTGSATLGSPASAVVTITDDDIPGTIAFSSPTYSVAEAGPTATIIAKRTVGSSGTVGVTYATSNGSATAGADYTAATGTLSWPNGDATDKTFTVTVSNDTTAEGDETVNLTLSAVTGGATLGAQSTAVLTIVDDDIPSALMHNSANLGTTYGSWGTSYNCATCHAMSTTNIKSVGTVITTPIGSRSVVFSRLTSSVTTGSGVFGNDQRTVTTGSTNVCEVCHHKTKYHQYSSNGVNPLTNSTHYNRKDCTTCHTHKTAFKPSGHTVPYYAVAGGHTSCASGIGCHANSNPAAPYPTTGAPDCRACHAKADPTVASTGCGSCHGNGSGTGEPTGTVHPDAAGSHTAHTSAPESATCVTCHDVGGTGGNADHGLGSGSPAVVNLATSLGVVGSTCTTASCHANVYGTGTVTTPAWGTAVGCTACHTTAIATTGPATGSHALHNLTTCSTCHAGTTNSTTTPTANHRDGNIDVILGYPANVTKHTTASGYGTSKCTTSMCHGTASPVWGVVSGLPTCQKCHSDSASATSSFKATDGLTTSIKSTIHVSHLNRTHSISTQVIACADCHTYPATTAAAGHIDTTLPAEVPMNGTLASQNTARTFNSGTKACTNVYCHGATTPTWSATLLSSNYALDCVKCHGLPPATSTHTGITVANIGELSKCSSVSPATGCHPSIAAAPTTYANIFADKTMHINGSIEGGSCTGCHDTGGPGLGATRLAITPQFGAGYSHHYQGAAAVDGKVCYACHWESDAAGSKTASHAGTAGAAVDLVIWNATTRPATNTPGTTSIAYTSGGATTTAIAERAKINSHCVGCHSDLNKTTQPFSASGDTGTPAKYAWDAQSIGAKWLSTATTPWGKFTGNFTNSKNTQTKAFSAHNNAANNARGWNTLAETLQGTAVVSNYPNTSGATAVPCFDCHNSHGSDLTGLVATTSYDSVIAKKGGILKQTTAGKGGYTYAYKPGAAGTTAQKNAHNAGAGLCFDCHSNAAANATTESGSKTVTGYGVYGATQAIIGYNDTPYFGKTGGVFPKTLTFSYTTLTGNTGTYNAGRAMGTNAGGHFGASATMTATPAGTIGGLCTPCHDPHGVSSTISTPANAVPLLKGTYVTSPYKMDLAPSGTQARGGGSKAPVRNGYIAGYHIDQNTMQTARTMKPTTQKSSWLFTTSAKSLQNLTDTQFAGLCINCHTKVALNNTAAVTTANWKSMKRVHNSVAGWAMTTGTGGNVGNKAHAYTCSKCHTPHNARLPRLLVTNCLDVKHLGRVLSQGTLPANTAAQTGTSGGRGRFPGGGGGAANIGTATNPGPWYFGSTASGSTVPAAATTCHQSGTAGGTTFNATSQQWNTKSLW